MTVQLTLYKLRMRQKRTAFLDLTAARFWFTDPEPTCTLNSLRVRVRRNSEQDLRLESSAELRRPNGRLSTIPYLELDRDRFCG